MLDVGIAESVMSAKANATENTNVMLNVRANGVDRTDVTEESNISNVGSRSCMLNVVGNWCIWLLVSNHISIFVLRAGIRVTNIDVTADVMLNVKAN